MNGFNLSSKEVRIVAGQQDEAQMRGGVSQELGQQFPHPDGPALSAGTGYKLPAAQLEAVVVPGISSQRGGGLTSGLIIRGVLEIEDPQRAGPAGRNG
jgi:hypothetical protein